MFFLQLLVRLSVSKNIKCFMLETSPLTVAPSTRLTSLSPPSQSSSTLSSSSPLSSNSPSPLSSPSPSVSFSISSRSEVRVSPSYMNLSVCLTTF